MSGAEEIGAREATLSWRDMFDTLRDAAQRGPLDVEDLERLAVAAFLVGKDDESARAWEHAHRVWQRLGDASRAARCAFWVGLPLLIRGEQARANGWFARGRRVLADTDSICAGRGYLLVPAAMESLGSGDAAAAAALYEEAAEIARRCGDRDLMAIAVLGRGEVAIGSGDTRTGLNLLDEVMVAATTGELSPIATGILYCAVVEACVNVFEVRRAAEWTNALTRWCEGQPELVPFRGQCLVHRSQVLQAHGAWAEALAEVVRARQRLSRPPHPAVGVAYYQQGELHRLRGEFAEALEAYRLASEHGRPPTPGLALLRLAEGRVDAAVAAVRRMMDESADPISRLAVLPAYVQIMVAAGDVDAARGASQELSGIAATWGNSVIDAMADHARACVLLADGDAAGALEAARRASRGWHDAAMPYEAALSQVVVARSCHVLGDDDAAAVDLHAARTTFERLGALPDVARVDALAGDGGHNPPSALTGREREVLALVAAGRTNREIAAALVISDHTVARHVQNIFTKLGVSSRVAAAAYAFEHRIG